jgi:hypothetical protein
LTMKGCEKDIDGLVGKGEALLAEQEYEEAMRVLNEAFEASGRSDAKVRCPPLYTPFDMFPDDALCSSRSRIAYTSHTSSSSRASRRTITRSSVSPETPIPRRSRKPCASPSLLLFLFHVLTAYLSQQPQSSQIRTSRQGRFRSQDGSAQRSLRGPLQSRTSCTFRRRGRPHGSSKPTGWEPLRWVWRVPGWRIPRWRSGWTSVCAVLPGWRFCAGWWRRAAVAFQSWALMCSRLGFGLCCCVSVVVIAFVGGGCAKERGGGGEAYMLLLIVYFYLSFTGCVHIPRSYFYHLPPHVHCSCLFTNRGSCCPWPCHSAYHGASPSSGDRSARHFASGCYRQAKQHDLVGLVNFG